MSTNKCLSRPPHAGMRHVALNVLDLELVEKFYVELLGFKVEWRPDAKNVYLTSGVDNLALHVVANISDRGQRLDHTGIIVDQIDQVDLWYEFLLENGVKMVSEARTHRDGARSFYCHDPEGTVVQVIFHPPLSKG